MLLLSFFPSSSQPRRPAARAEALASSRSGSRFNASAVRISAIAVWG